MLVLNATGAFGWGLCVIVVLCLWYLGSVYFWGNLNMVCFCVVESNNNKNKNLFEIPIHFTISVRGINVTPSKTQYKI